MVRYYHFDEGDLSLLHYTNLYMSFRFSTAVPVFIVLSAIMNSLNWKNWKMGWAEMPNITWKISDHRDRCRRSSKCKRQGHRIQRRDMTGSAKHWGWQGKDYRLQDPRYSWQEDIGKRLHAEHLSKENYVPRQVHRCRGVWPKKTLITRLLWRNLSEIAFFINIIRMLCKNFNLPQSCPCWIQSGSPAT